MSSLPDAYTNKTNIPNKLNKIVINKIVKTNFAKIDSFAKKKQNFPTYFITEIDLPIVKKCLLYVFNKLDSKDGMDEVNKLQQKFVESNLKDERNIGNTFQFIEEHCNNDSHYALYYLLTARLLDHRRIELRSKLIDTKAELEESVTELASLKSDYQELQDKHSLILAERRAKDWDNLSQRTQIGRLTNDLARTKSLLEEEQCSKTKLFEKFNRLKTNFAEHLTNRLQSHQTKNKELNQELTETKKQLETEKSSNIKIANSHRKEVIDKLLGSLRGEKEKLEKLLNEKDKALLKSATSVKQLEKEITDTKDKYKSDNEKIIFNHQQEIDKLHGQVTKLKDSLDLKNTQLAKLSNFESEHQNLQRFLTEKDEQLQSIQDCRDLLAEKNIESSREKDKLIEEKQKLSDLLAEANKKVQGLRSDFLSSKQPKVRRLRTTKKNNKKALQFVHLSTVDMSLNLASKLQELKQSLGSPKAFQISKLTNTPMIQTVKASFPNAEIRDKFLQEHRQVRMRNWNKGPDKSQKTETFNFKKRIIIKGSFTENQILVNENSLCKNLLLNNIVPTKIQTFNKKTWCVVIIHLPCNGDEERHRNFNLNLEKFGHGTSDFKNGSMFWWKSRSRRRNC